MQARQEMEGDQETYGIVRQWYLGDEVWGNYNISH